MNTPNRHLHKIHALVVYRKSLWNAQGCQHLTSLTKNEGWWLPLNFAFPVYNVKILHMHCAKIPTSSLLDESHWLGLYLFIRQCEQRRHHIIVSQYFPSICIFQSSQYACTISHVEGIHQQKPMIEMETQSVSPFCFWGHVK